MFHELYFPTFLVAVYQEEYGYCYTRSLPNWGAEIVRSWLSVNSPIATWGERAVYHSKSYSSKSSDRRSWLRTHILNFSLTSGHTWVCSRYHTYVVHVCAARIRPVMFAHSRLITIWGLKDRVVMLITWICICESPAVAQRRVYELPPVSLSAHKLVCLLAAQQLYATEENTAFVVICKKILLHRSCQRMELQRFRSSSRPSRHLIKWPVCPWDVTFPKYTSVYTLNKAQLIIVMCILQRLVVSYTP